jgi:hypothetical protein
MDFIPGVNDNDSELKFCLFQDVDGETDAPDDKDMRPFSRVGPRRRFRLKLL